MIIDAHAHLETKLMSLADQLAEMNLNKVGRTVLASHLTTEPESRKPEILMKIQREMFNNDWLRPIGIKITQSMYRKEGQWDIGVLKYFTEVKAEKLTIIKVPDNKLIAEAIEKYPDRFWGWISVNPTQKGAVDEVEKYRTARGFVGIKVHPFWHRFGVGDLRAIADYASQYRLPIHVHLGFGESGDFAGLTDKYPKVKWIFGHLGVPFYKKLWREVGNFENVALDIASAYHVDQSLFKQAIAKLGSKKIFFATDTPYTTSGKTSIFLKWIDQLSISDSEKEGLRGQNFLNYMAGTCAF